MSKKKAAVASGLLTEEQLTVRNTDQFISNFSELSNAGIGVTICRTREPMRAADAIREYAAAANREFRVWTVTHGWELYDNENPDAETQHDKTSEPIPALRKLTDPEAGFAEDSISVMMYPHQFLAKSAMLQQQVKDYARLFVDDSRRLMLVVPPSFKAPEEIEEDVGFVDFDVPSYAERKDSYADLLSMLPDEDAKGNKVDLEPKFSEAEIDQILTTASGMTALEFENAVSRALVKHRPTLPNADINDFVADIMEVKTEVVKRSEILEMMEPGKMSEIGGLEELKAWIATRAKCFTPEARAAGIETPKGIALIGPPGTGKSLGAKAVASELNIPALKLDIGRVFNSLVGESEARIRAALKMVDDMSPCVLMIDEADKAFAGQAGGGHGGDSGVGMRVLGTILTWMQETESRVFMVVTANRVQNLPTEFLRRGRLDEVWSVTTPHEDERLDILRIHLRKRGTDPDTVEGLDEVAASTAGYVPSELEAAVKDARIAAFVNGEDLNGEHITAEIGHIKPISVAHAEDFRQMAEWAETHARPASRYTAPSLPAGETTAPRARQRGRNISLDG